MAPRIHAGSLRSLGGGAHGRLEHLSATFLRRAVPGLVPLRRRRRARRGRLARLHRGSPSDRPLDRGTRRLLTGPTGQAQRIRRRSGRHGHLGYLVAYSADRRKVGGGPRSFRERLPDGSAAPSARDHSDLAVLDHRALRARALPPALERRRHLGLDPRPGPKKNGQVARQRRHSARVPREVQQRRRALLGWISAPRRGHGVQRRADESRPAPRDKDPQRQPFRPFAHGRFRNRRSRIGAHGSRRCDAGAPFRDRRGGDRRVRRLRPCAGPRGHRVVLLVLLRRLPRAREGPRLRRRVRGRPGFGPARLVIKPVGDLAPVRAVSPVLHRRGLVLVAVRLDSYRPLAVSARAGRGGR